MMDDQKIKELAKSLPFGIDTVRRMANNFKYLFGREPTENDPELMFPSELSIFAKIKAKSELNQKLEKAKKLL